MWKQIMYLIFISLGSIWNWSGWVFDGETEGVCSRQKDQIWRKSNSHKNVRKDADWSSINYTYATEIITLVLVLLLSIVRAGTSGRFESILPVLAITNVSTTERVNNIQNSIYSTQLTPPCVVWSYSKWSVGLEQISNELHFFTILVHTAIPWNHLDNNTVHAKMLRQF